MDDAAPTHVAAIRNGLKDFALERTAATYAQTLLDDLAITSQRPVSIIDEHPALTWARSGLMELTGHADGAPQMCPVPLAACAEGVLAALTSLAPDANLFDDLRGSTLLAERAALSGLSRNGATSVGGSCRLLQAVDGIIAVNLVRPDDWALLEAWLEAPTADWTAIANCLVQQSSSVLVERARWLGLAVASSTLPSASAAWFEVAAEGKRQAPRRRPRVVDLSSLWAGPLCGRLLQRLGAEVIKVESVSRPDGARQGPADFFDTMNAGKASVALDFTTAAGRAQLEGLLDQADIVIEASRPRALRQLGIDAEARVRSQPGLTWISLTGYGRQVPQDQWIAYGDDAGVAGGLSELLHIGSGENLFCADAIADPLTGLHAALAAWATMLDGGGRLLSIALRDVVAHVAGFGPAISNDQLVERTRDWQRRAEGQVAAPRAARPDRHANSLGADTAAVLREWRAAC